MPGDDRPPLVRPGMAAPACFSTSAHALTGTISNPDLRSAIVTECLQLFGWGDAADRLPCRSGPPAPQFINCPGGGAVALDRSGFWVGLKLIAPSCRPAPSDAAGRTVTPGITPASQRSLWPVHFSH